MTIRSTDALGTWVPRSLIRHKTSLALCLAFSVASIASAAPSDEAPAVDEKSLVRASPGTTMLIDRTSIVPYKDVKNAWQFIAVQDDLGESDFDREITTIAVKCDERESRWLKVDSIKDGKLALTVFLDHQMDFESVDEYPEEQDFLNYVCPLAKQDRGSAQNAPQTSAGASAEAPVNRASSAAKAEPTAAQTASKSSDPKAEALLAALRDAERALIAQIEQNELKKAEEYRRLNIGERQNMQRDEGYEPYPRLPKIDKSGLAIASAERVANEERAAAGTHR